MKTIVSQLTVAGLLSLCATSTAVLAASVVQPGETVGISVGAPLKPGFHFVNATNWGCRNTSPSKTCIGADYPIIAWSTPWQPLNARLQFIVSLPVAELEIVHVYSAHGLYNPFFAGQLAWKLGNGWNFSYLLSTHTDIRSDVAWNSTSLNQGFALSYVADGWNLTANLIYGINFPHVSSRPQLSPCPPLGTTGCNPDFLNIDLTATKKFGDLEIGAVGFGSMDLNQPVPVYAKQSQFAIGGLIGYDFGKIEWQGYITRDVYERNYGGKDLRGWMRLLVRLGDPFAPEPAPSSAFPVKAARK